MINPPKLYELIENIVSNSYGYKDISEFFHLCTSIAISYIRNQQYNQNFYMKISTINSKDIEDFAIDAVSTLFARDEKRSFYVLKKYFESRLREIQEEKEYSFVLLRKLVISKVKQEMVEYYRKEDPAGWKIYRNIQLAPIRNLNIGVFSDFHKTYFYHKDSPDNLRIPEALKPELPEIENKVLEIWLIEVLKKSSKVPMIIEEILSGLKNQNEFREFVSRKKIFKCLKAVSGVTIVPFNENVQKVYLVESKIDLSEDILSAVKNLKFFFHSVLNETYFNKGKVSDKEFKIYQEILDLYFGDLLNDGITEMLPYYMNHEPDKCWLKDNWQIHKNRLEYLIKLGKQYLKSIFEVST